MDRGRNVARTQRVPVVPCSPAAENDGALLSISISYYPRGYLAGEMAYEILVNGADPATMEIAYAPNFTPKYNAANCEALGLTPPEGYEAIAAE